MAYDWVFQGLLNTVTEAAGNAGARYIGSMSPLAGIIRAGADAGLSGVQILSSFRNAGGTVGNETFYALHQAVLQTSFSQDQLANLLNGDLSGIAKLPGGKAGQYQLNFILHNMTLGPDGKPEYTTSTFAMMQNDLDIQGGLNAMGQISTSMSKTGEPYPQSIGFELQSVYQYTGT